MIKDSFGKYVDIYEKVEFDSKKVSMWLGSFKSFLLIDNVISEQFSFEATFRRRNKDLEKVELKGGELKFKMSSLNSTNVLD